MYRNYYSVNDMPQRIDKREEKAKDIQKVSEVKKQEDNKSGLLSRLEKDDIILLAVILILLADDCDDKLLLLALGAVFVSGIS